MKKDPQKNSNESRAPVTEKVIFDEISASNFSEHSMDLILRFVSQLIWTPEKIIDSRFTRSAATKLANRLIKDLGAGHDSFVKRERRDAPSEDGEAEVAGEQLPDGQAHMIIDAMLAEQDEVRSSGQNALSFYYFEAVKCILEEKGALKRFNTFVRTELGQARVTRQSDAPKISGAPTRPLSHTQQDAFDFCHSIGRMFFSEQKPLPNIQVRSFPLMAGPTGAGKSHLVRQLAETLNCRYIRMDYGNWIPRGAREDPNTMEAFGEAALANERVLVHLDELDKLRGDYSTGWEISVKNDIWKLLDRPVDLSYLNCAQSYEGGEAAFNELFCKRVWIVGSGTWQEVFDAPGKNIGFVSAEGDDRSRAADLIERIRESRLIPSELTGRFNSKIQLIGYPTVDEVVDLMQASGVELNEAHQEQLATSMVHSGFRAVEDVVTDIALERFEAMEAQPSEAPAMQPLEAECLQSESFVGRTGEYSVMPQRMGRAYGVRATHQANGTVNLVWFREQRGVNCAMRDGFSKGQPLESVAPISFLPLWDTFAKRWGLTTYCTVSEEVFQSWSPNPCEILPSCDRSQRPGDVFNFWRELHQRREHGYLSQRLDELSRTAGELHAAIHPDSRRKELQESRYSISAAILHGQGGSRSKDGDAWSGPSLTDLYRQCEKEVNEGLEWLRRHLGAPANWRPEIQDCIIEWEAVLIQHQIDKILNESITCETARCPAKIAAYLDIIEPDLSWERLSEVMRARFRPFLKPYQSEALIA